MCISRRLWIYNVIGFGGVLSLGITPCQSKTLSPPDFESTYTNKASLEAFAVC